MGADGDAKGARPRTLVLIGPRAAGKTTLGKALAERKKAVFVDGDLALEAAVGEPAGAYLARVGEPAFRAVEERVTRGLLDQAARSRGAVLALGGGAVLAQAVQAALRDLGLFVVFVTADPDVLVTRMLASPTVRPALTKMNLRDEVVAVLLERLPVYERLARVVVDTTRSNVEECCDLVLALLDDFGR